MLNTYINIDLHIHSYASRHKEGKTQGYDVSPVQDSTIANLDTLFVKLEEYHIALFAFTDHNVFNAALYREAKKRIESKKALYEQKHPELKEKHYNGYEELYPREILPGVEFDVRRPGEPKTGHVLVIFNPITDSDIDKIQKMVFSDDDLENAKSKKDNATGKDIRTNSMIERSQKDFFFKWDDFELLLKSIGCSAIIIGEQRSEIINTGHTGNGHADVISAQNDDEATKIATLGSISALECSSPRNESVLLRDLKSLGIPESKPIFIGSDCHDWKAYPYHHLKFDNNGNVMPSLRDKPGFPTCVKALPNFKGLLMCVTSPKTRFFPQKATMSPYIHWIDINGEHVQLSQGINAIIGENGSGKTYILRSIYEQKSTLKKDYKSFSEKNNICCDNASLSSITSIKQGDLSNDLKEYGTGVIKSLKKENEIGNYDNIAFESAFTNFTDSMFKRFKAQIEFNGLMSNLPSVYLTLANQNDSKPGTFINVSYDLDFQSSTNRYKEAYDEMEKIKIAFDGIHNETTAVLRELGDEPTQKFNSARDNIESILNLLKYRQEDKQTEIALKGFIKTSIDDYNASITELMNAPQKALMAYSEGKKSFVDSVCSVCKAIYELPDYPSFPQKITSGIREVTYGDIKLIKSAKYHDADLSGLYSDLMFMSGKNSESEWVNIKSVVDVENTIKQLTNATTLDDIQKGMQLNLKRFFTKAEESQEIIIDTTDLTNQKEGATPGQQSLSFFKCLAATNDSNPVITIDQPEDNISPKNIVKYLSLYLAKLAYNANTNHQLIIVTHNPYLVVNCDSDNVICLESRNQVINCKAGCLEDDDSGIMKFIESNMDGGKKAIQDRLNYYSEVKDDEKD
jgi:predicted ATPase/ElaB/YqjD/DUF883 family membrane-anchored ribosome-binding protein